MELLNAIKDLVLHFGYIGIFCGVMLEYACFPISSEVLLPFIGFASAAGELPLIIVILCATAGGVAGSSFCYLLGRIGGNFIRKLCSRLKTLDLGCQKAENLFLTYGKSSVFFARLFPIARTYISFPAGMMKLPYHIFLFYTTAGAFLWNTVLLSIGFFLGEYRERYLIFLKEYGSIAIFFFLLLILLFWYNRKKRRNKNSL